MSDEDYIDSDPEELQSFVEESNSLQSSDESFAPVLRRHPKELDLCLDRLIVPGNYRTLVSCGRLVCLKVDDPKKRHTLVVDLAYPYMIRLSPSFQAVFYLAAKDLYPEALKNVSPLNVKGILKLFSAEEIIGIMVTVYTYTQIKKICPEEEWHIAMPAIHTHLAVGRSLGLAVLDISEGFAMVVGALRPLAFALIAKHEAESYPKYRRRCSMQEMLFDLSEEERLWGYTHNHLAACIAQKFGFGVKKANGLAADSSDSEGLDAEEFRWCLVRDLVSRLIIGELSPGDLSSLELELDQDAVTEFEGALPRIIRQAEENFSWITARKTSVKEGILEQLQNN